MNNYEFWETYLDNVKVKLTNLLNSKKNFRVDLHIHTNYSSDGVLPLREVIELYKNNGFDIISITDHDTIQAYDELYEMITNDELRDIIVIPGVEFTVLRTEYGGQCHILQYMFNPKDINIMRASKKSLGSYYTRTTKQFRRINENITLQYFIKKKAIKINEEEYYLYLKNQKISIPDYDSLVKYIHSKLIEKKVDVLDVFSKLEKDNELDSCIERKQMKSDRYKKLRLKYKDDKNARSNTRLLLSILGVRNVDDDYYPEYPSCGSISVNNYGQLTIEELNKDYLTIFAHPTETSIAEVKKIIDENVFIKGIEDNIKNPYLKPKVFTELAKDKKLYISKGSDFHKLEDLDYDSDFYKYSKDDLIKLRWFFVNGQD